MKNELPEELERIAQNDYMIDSNYTEDGKILLRAARYIRDIEENKELGEREED